MNAIVDYDFGPTARNRLADTHDEGPNGAVAALETFYYALNNADLNVLSQVWSDGQFAQLNNPVGGILRSGAAITDLYRGLFSSGLKVQVSFTDAATYLSTGSAVFAGRELGTYVNTAGEQTALHIRTSRLFGWHPEQRQWRQLHHHGSIDDPDALAAYQAAARR
jgi:hypothetical protein